MPKLIYLTLPFIFSFVLPGCTVLHEGPSVRAMPGSYRTVSTFGHDDLRCQNYAKQKSGHLSPNQVRDEIAGEQAFVGALFGALIGAAIGSSPQDAAIGAAAGALFGGLSGSEEGTLVAGDIQYDYDRAYTSCMYSAGHKVPARHIKYIEQAPKPIPQISTPYGVPPDFRR